jgi:uncharacterized protein YqjF (DUF2071 family)
MRDVAPPAAPWVGRMRWCDLAFVHWPVPPAVLRPLVPTGLEIDTFEGAAWIGVVPFRMEGVRLRAAPPVPTAHAFPEINVRTYVRAGGRLGVWFFSLDAASRLAVRGARFMFNLPYFDANIAVRQEGATVHYQSRRRHRGAPAARFEARYGASGEPYEAAPGSLDHFLVERYCLFMFHPRRRLGVIDVDHHPWRLQPGHAEISVNMMLDAAGVPLPAGRPVVHVAQPVDVHAWPARWGIG